MFFISMGSRRFRKSYRLINRKRRVNSKTQRNKRTRAEFNKKFILNFTRTKLSNEEILLLSKGTKFVPSPNIFHVRNNIMADFIELARKMRCRFCYSNTSENTELHPLYLKTGHVPPRCNNALENYVTDTMLAISSLEVNSFKDNLSRVERKSLVKISNNSEIYISKADKNNTTVLIDKNNYTRAGENHLRSIYYVELEQPNTASISKKIEEIIRKLFSQKEIDMKTYNFLTQSHNPKHGHMYFLPKIHKINPEVVKNIIKQGFNHSDIEVAFRPIVNKSNSPTCRIEKFLDLIVKPLLRKDPFFIQDSKDFIVKLEKEKIENKCFLIAYDVTSMYTNMQIKDLQETLVNNLEKIDKLSYNFQIPNLADLAELIKIVLENNEFEFNGHIYKQIIGAPMGGILSPTCTDLHLASILKMILDKFQYRTHIKLHCQYRDDGFMVFTGNMLQIEEFFSIANKIDNLLKFTYEVSEELMTYLDLEVYKGNRFHINGILDVKSHIKKTETYQYLPPNSSHPQSTFKSITVGETIRHIRNNNNEIDLNKHLINLELKLVARGYNKRITRDLISDTCNKVKRCHTLTRKTIKKNIPLTLITKYNPAVKGLGRALRKSWNNLQSDEICRQIFKKVPIIAYKRSRNLKEYFAETRH